MADLKAIASQIRRDIVRMVHGASSGHPGGSLGCTDFFTALYVEQKIIQLLENHGYKRVTSDDWFEIDEDAIKVLIKITKELKFHIKKWEREHLLLNV